MKKLTIKRTIRQIAKREGIRENQVREEIKKAILQGYLNQGETNNWVEMFGVGRLPSPEEFIIKISNAVLK